MSPDFLPEQDEPDARFRVARRQAGRRMHADELRRKEREWQALAAVVCLGLVAVLLVTIVALMRQ